MKTIREALGGLVTAFRTLTILPVPGKDANRMASSLPWFPVVGLALGLIVYCSASAVNYATSGKWPEMSAFTALVAGTLLTRGFHLDGLSDWADSFGSIADRKRMLEIMKDSRVGVFGVLALVCVMLGKWIALVRLWQLHAGYWIVAAYVISRTMQVELATSLPYARLEGGTGQDFIKGSRLHHRILALALAVMIVCAIFNANGVIAVAIGLLVCRLFGLSCRKRLGGITGDTLGASSEIVELVVLLATASFLNR